MLPIVPTVTVKIISISKITHAYVLLAITCGSINVNFAHKRFLTVYLVIQEQFVLSVLKVLSFPMIKNPVVAHKIMILKMGHAFSKIFLYKF